MSENNKNEFMDYITFPRTFEKYRWYKPLLTIVLVLIMYFVFQIILIFIFNTIYGQNILFEIVNGGYETLNTSDVSVYFSYLSVGIFIPAIYIASKIVPYRPFSSYSSSRGGWNWKIYFKSLTIPLVIYIIYCIIDLTINRNGTGVIQISPILLILCLILVPFQCIAEEYLFRGLLMQSFGSWFKIPILAIIIQSIILCNIHN